MDDPYYSITEASETALTVKGSKFIANAGRVNSTEEAASFVIEISSRYPDATHNCYAYRIGVGDRAELRFSDAGEPSGTAGRPILQAIEANNLTNLAVVVTRYFGGTKLGIGGLIRAYSAAALQVLDQARVIESYPTIRLELRFSFELANLVHQALARIDGNVVASNFEDGTSYVVRIKARDEMAFRTQVEELTRGRVEFVKL